MGGSDKGLVPIAGRPMIEHVLERLVPQVKQVLINANRNLDRYSQYGFPVVCDSVGDFAGPLAGMASAMQNAKQAWLLTVPCDSPLLPADLAERMYAQMIRDDAEIAVADDGERMHPVFCLLRRDLLASVLEFLDGGERKIDRWFGQHHTVVVDFSDNPDAFLNVNRREDKALLEAKLAA
jgi:molybdopterin-guanine dinucleotide biosynthesis protein A